MKLQLDTQAKTIKIEGEVKLGELFTTLEQLLPKNAWKEFTLEANTVINNWNTPIVIHEPIYQYPWWDHNKVYCRSTEGTGLPVRNEAVTAEYSLKAGIFNVEL